MFALGNLLLSSVYYSFYFENYRVGGEGSKNNHIDEKIRSNNENEYLNLKQHEKLYSIIPNIFQKIKAVK